MKRKRSSIYNCKHYQKFSQIFNYNILLVLFSLDEKIEKYSKPPIIHYQILNDKKYKLINLLVTSPINSQ